MSNDFDDATQLGSIGHNPKAFPANPASSSRRSTRRICRSSRQADEDPEGTLLSAHGTAQPALPQQSAPATPNQPRFRQPMPQNLRQPAANPAVAMPAQQPSSQPNPSSPASLYSPSNNPSRSSTCP